MTPTEWTIPSKLLSEDKMREMIYYFVILCSKPNTQQKF